MVRPTYVHALQTGSQTQNSGNKSSTHTDEESGENENKSHEDQNANSNSGHRRDRFGEIQPITTDNPGLILVSAQLTEKNHIPWSQSMIRALRAKRRLDFVLKDDLEPLSDSTEYERWAELDSLVFSWLINSISRDLSESFLYATTSRELWKELKMRYGESNGPKLFRLKQDLTRSVQGSQSLTSYFTKLKRMWDEIAMLKSISSCNCGGSKKIVQELCEEDQLIQFLSGLTVDYEHVKKIVQEFSQFWLSAWLMGKGVLDILNNQCVLWNV